MPTCRQCNNEVDVLKMVKVDGKKQKICEDCAERVAEQIRETGEQADVFIADVAHASAVKSMVEGVLRRIGRIDILV